jgi:nucleoside-diphosphate-sugar epimerase
MHQEIPAFEVDVRDIDFTDLLSFDAVVHLAALSGGDCGEVNPALTHEINYEATIHLAKLCKQANVSRFVFASTCAVYGRGGCELLDEDSPTSPLTAFARSKSRCERELPRLADKDFLTVILRHPTPYGVSPRIRLDTVVNDFVASAVTTGQVALQSAGGAWRPLAHVEDIAQVYAVVLSAPDDLVHNQIFNLAQSDENYRVIDIADAVTEYVPQSTRVSTHKSFDESSYRVDGSKLRRTFPDLNTRWTLPFGIRQLRAAMLSGGLTPGDWRSDRYRRALRLRGLMDREALGADLRFLEPASL